MKTRSATRSVALRCPAETQNPHKRRLCKMSARAGLASYGRGYLQHNAGNCLNMAMGVRGGSSCCEWLSSTSAYLHPQQEKGDCVGGVAVRNPTPH